VQPVRFFFKNTRYVRISRTDPTILCIASNYAVKTSKKPLFRPTKVINANSLASLLPGNSSTAGATNSLRRTGLGFCTRLLQVAVDNYKPQAAPTAPITDQQNYSAAGTIGLERKEYLWLIRNTGLKVESPISRGSKIGHTAVQASSPIAHPSSGAAEDYTRT